MNHNIHLHIYREPAPINPNEKRLLDAQARIVNAVSDPAPMTAGEPLKGSFAVPTNSILGGIQNNPNRPRPLRDWLATKLIDAAVAKGHDRAKAEALVDQMAGERPLIDWLLNGGWQKLLDLFLELLASG